MKHNGSPHCRAEICGALGEIAYSVVKSIFQLAVDNIVKLVCNVIGFFKRQTRFHYLKPDVVFFAKHNAYALVR